jgi:hypothetical protein
MASADDEGLTPEQRINKLFRTALHLDASLEWESGQSPRVLLRHEHASRCVDMAPVSREEMGRLLQSVMDDRQWMTFGETGTAEFSHAPDIAGQGLRVRVLMEGGQLRVAAQPLRWDEPGAAADRPRD